jgi:PmbA protein
MKTDPHSPLDHHDLIPAATQLLELALKAGAQDADVLIAHGRALTIGVREGKLEDIDSSEGKDIGLRVLIGKRQAHVSSSDIANTSLETLAERGVAMAKLAPEDPYCELPPTSAYAHDDQELHVFDPTHIDAEQLLARAHTLEAATLNVEGILQAEGASAYASSGSAYFMTSNGFAKGWRSTRHGLSVSAFASDGTNMERDYDYNSTRWYEDCEAPEDIGRRAAQRALSRIGAQQLPSAQMPVIFDRRVSGQLLDTFLNSISGPTVARGVSFYKDAMGEQIFHPAINITDDPAIRRGHGSRPWDGEGVTNTKMGLITNGVLNSWLLNTASATQLGLELTGHAHRDVGSPASVSASNAYIHAGENSVSALLKDIDKGLIITEMFGASVNSNTGDYSVGIAGFSVENGERAGPVSEITVAGNLKDMFKSVIAANDLVFDDCICAPSLLMPNMVIAGE